MIIKSVCQDFIVMNQFLLCRHGYILWTLRIILCRPVICWWVTRILKIGSVNTCCPTTCYSDQTTNSETTRTCSGSCASQVCTLIGWVTCSIIPWGWCARSLLPRNNCKKGQNWLKWNFLKKNGLHSGREVKF